MLRRIPVYPTPGVRRRALHRSLTTLACSIGYQEDESNALLRTFAALFAVTLLALPAAAQEQTGSITGVVKDSSGAVLPGATVEARSPSAVGVSTAVTDANGIYRFPALPPGTYEISATLQGFVAGEGQPTRWCRWASSSRSI